jgi:peptidyl-prolyl cis-trans isomerase C
MAAVVENPFAGVERQARRGRVRQFIAEPLVQFLALGAVIFAFTQLANRSGEEAAGAIVVDDARIARLSELYQAQMGAPPTADQLAHLVESFIREEVLYREARKLGLDRDDEIVRRRLVQKIEFLSSDLAAIAEPSDAELRSYYQKHSEKFVMPGTATLSHVYFSTDERGEEGAKQAAETALASLTARAVEGARSIGDLFPLQMAYSAADRRSLAQIFGQTAFVEAAFSEVPGLWTGPVRSGYGWHLIYIEQRTADALMDFEAARSRVRKVYMEERRRENDQRRYRELASQYDIVRTDKQEQHR